MKHLLLPLLLLTAFTLNGQDVDFSAAAIPVELKAGAKAVVRRHDLIYDVASAHQATITEYQVITVLDDGHGGANRLVVFYDNDSKITRFKATLYDAAGKKVRSARKDEIEDVRYLTGGQFYTDSRVQTTVLEHLSYPYTVEFEIERKLTNFGIVSFPHWSPQRYERSVESATYTAYVPTDNELLYKTNLLPEPVTTKEKGRIKHAWRVENLPAVKGENASPPATVTLPYLRTSLRNFDTGDYQGSTESWKTFGQFVNQLIEGRDVLPSALAELVHETTDGLTTDREKINALYRLMQGRTRYVGVQLGIGGWQPFSAEYVETNRYGDCKALSNYMGAMLSEIGVESYRVLVDWNDSSYYPVDESFTTAAFNHMILYVPSEDMYLECTSSYSPTGYLGDGKGDRNVLHVTPEGGKLVKTPAARASDNGYLQTTDLAIGATGVAAFRLHGRYHGSSQETLRRYAASEKDQTKQKEWLERNGYLPDNTGNGYSLTYDDSAPVAEITYATTVPGYVRKLGQRMFVPLNKFHAFDKVPDKLEKRKFPISRNTARFFVDTVRITFPEGMGVESLGETKTTIDHPVGQYRAEVKTGANSLTWIRTLKYTPAELPAEAYEDYRQFFVDVSKAERRQVVLRKKRTK